MQLVKPVVVHQWRTLFSLATFKCNQAVLTKSSLFAIVSIIATGSLFFFFFFSFFFLTFDFWLLHVFRYCNIRKNSLHHLQLNSSLRGKCLNRNAEFCLACIFLYSERIRRFTISARIQENTDQKKIRNRTLFTLCFSNFIREVVILLLILWSVN